MAEVGGHLLMKFRDGAFREVPRKLTDVELSLPGAREGWNDGLAVAEILTDMELTALIERTRVNESFAIDCPDLTDYDYNRVGAKCRALEWVQAERQRAERSRQRIEGR
ncbi:hypothetical protein [Lacticaseibacillus nasuensis]|uniref:hypothetical protein n=1 Tax=Lacticaseibacillus nasuensis TaxID=944671 RepID=UPI002245B92C|nr:hypothetical protein [Lacticaseibacillus nasuensis]MCX2455662.1 hypothetical protein [Lacticaseibacillus nasuensis]